MIIFYTQSAAHLAHNIHLPRGRYSIKQFSDGELYLKLEDTVCDKKVWIVTSTQAPAENLLELFFLLDVLTRTGVKHINLFFTYFGYARQSEPLQGEVASTAFICNVLKKFPLDSVLIMHAHAADVLRSLLNFRNIIDFTFFADVARNYDAIVAPDHGAVAFAQRIAQQCNKELIMLRKKRPHQEEVEIQEIEGDVVDKKLLIVDDIIATGHTLMQAATALKKQGAQTISAAATHGVFSYDAYANLERSDISKIYVTNTIHKSYPANISVYDVGPCIEQEILK